MKRDIPVEINPELDLYTRTYYSLLRSSGEVEVRAFEEAHSYCHSALHEGALSSRPDLSAFAYAAGRLPAAMIETARILLAQSHELFESAGFAVRDWDAVKSRGRRRPLRYDGDGTLAVFIASASDIDDLIPIVTAYQIEWNKMHGLLAQLSSGGRIPTKLPNHAGIAKLLDIDKDGILTLISAFGSEELFDRGIREIISRPLRLRVRMLSASYSQYNRAAQRWWSGVEPTYMEASEQRRPPVYFVSSNTHAVANLIGGYARCHQDEIAAWVRKKNPEGLAQAVKEAEKSGDERKILPFLYYILRNYIHAEPTRMREVRTFELGGGLSHLSEPGHIDVDAQIISLSDLDPERLDPRLHIPGLERLKESRALIINIDYPLGMAAYHLLSRVGQGVGDIRGIHVMGKAATLNGRVGDVSISGAVFDEHSRNTFLFRNAFTAEDVMPWLQHGSVFDGQRALTVRSAFLQNKEYMSGFYQEGYTVLEMEAGPFLSAIYELVNPTRVPHGEMVHLSAQVPYDVGILHYASDTPYSRRQSLLSKSLSYFGVDSTYACGIAIVRRILQREIEFVEMETKQRVAGSLAHRHTLPPIRDNSTRSPRVTSKSRPRSS